MMMSATKLRLSNMSEEERKNLIPIQYGHLPKDCIDIDHAEKLLNDSWQDESKEERDEAVKELLEQLQ